jgi:hypothetical protein
VKSTTARAAFAGVLLLGGCSLWPTRHAAETPSVSPEQPLVSDKIQTEAQAIEIGKDCTVGHPDGDWHAVLSNRIWHVRLKGFDKHCPDAITLDVAAANGERGNCVLCVTG